MPLSFNMLLEGNSSSNQTNATTSLLELQGNLTERARIVMTLLYTITFLVGLVGNSLGMYVVCQKCGIKGATHLLIANLACSNLLITFIVMPMSVLYLYNEHRWHAGLAGSITCKLSQFLFMFPIAASILTILVVSIDRFYAVFYPLNGQVFRRPKTMTATIWISSAILVSPSFVIFQAVLSSDGEWRCVTYFGQDRRLASVLTKVYFSVLFVLLYLLPLLIITLLYTLISCKLHRRKVPGQARSKTTRTTADKSKRKIVKVLVMIVLAFALCWFPAHVIHYYAIFQSDDYQNLPPYLHPLLLWVSHTNSAIDPCLYILLSQNFRREFRQVLTHCGYFQKRKRIEKRMSRMTSNFSKRNWGSRRDSGFWSFRKTDAGQKSAGGKKQTANFVGVLAWSPTGNRNSPRELHDLAV